MADKAPRNEGEGNRTAARAYDKHATEFAHSGKVKDAAKAARESLDSPEGDELRKAEAEGKRPARH